MSNLNIHKISPTLSGKERAVMMALDLDAKFKTGKDALTKEERNSLLDFKNNNDYYVYGFYWDLKQFGIIFIVSSIEKSFLRLFINVLLLLDSENEQSVFGQPRNELFEEVQSNLNDAHTYKEVVKRMSEEFDFPLLGEYHLEKIDSYIASMGFFVNVVNRVLQENELEKITPKLDENIIQEMIETYKRKMPKNVL